MLSDTKRIEEKNLAFSDSIKQNLSIIHADLENSLNKLSPYSLNQSSCSEKEPQPFNNQQNDIFKQNLKLLNILFNLWQKDQIKSMLIYNKLIQRCNNLQFNSNPILSNTLFHKNLWPLMTYLLENELKFNRIKDNSRIVDVWYQFIATQQKVLFEKILQQNLLKNINLGEWFRQQCLQLLFQNFYINNKKAYTNFVVNFVLYGLTFLFDQSIFILKQICQGKEKQNYFVNQRNLTKISHIRLNYIQKFNLESKS